MDESADESSVRVALRIRPQLAKERIDMCQVCTSVTDDCNQVLMGKDKAFTFDFVFDMHTQQKAVYDNCSQQLIEGTFEGYNATIVAYGQTGSGKTYTMGSGFEVGSDDDCVGIIPRAVEHLFTGIENRRNKANEKGEPPPDFKVNAQFMELYNEEIHDLLDTTRDITDKSKKSHIKIHEDAGGGIYCVGMTTKPVHSLQDTMQCLHMGALSRATASTNMNAQSSRSHAIFTLHIRQTRMVKEEIHQENEKETDTTEIVNEFETLTAKFHFVDLAGSERLKRTGATGDRAKEGISINCGLLALGNVISALGDVTKKGCHVPYRDSKLTRLLTDSLGGNSRTVMIACVSPSDRDFMETLNTLKYANRARNIRNKVMVNQDKTSKQISILRAELMTLQAELSEYKAGKKLVGEDGIETINDMFHENTMLQAENNNLRQRIKALQESIEQLKTKNVELLVERDARGIASLGGEAANEEVQKLIQGYIKEIEELRLKLLEAETMSEQMRKVGSRTPSRMMSTTPAPDTSYHGSITNNLIQDAKLEILEERKLLQHNVPKSAKRRPSEKENETEIILDHVNSTETDPFPEEIEPLDEDEEEEEEDLNDSNTEEDDEEPEIKSMEESQSKNKNCENTEDADNLHEDLANLTCDISIKQKLIEELEMSQKRLQAMKSQYEDKLGSLQARIKETEAERDRVLSSLGDIQSHSQEKVTKVKTEYEKKLATIQNEVKKVQAAKREHAKLLKNQSHHEKQLKTLQRDLGEMKTFKVKLMNQIKEECGKRRQVELLRTRETGQLKKEQRILEGQMQKLQTEKRQKDIVLKRKVEEIESLKNREKRPMSSKVAGRVGAYEKPPTKPYNVFSSSQVTRRRKKSEFSAKAAKNKWDAVERSVTSIIIKKQTVSHMERDMDRWLKERECKGKKIEKLQKKLQKAVNENRNEQVKSMSEQMEQVKNDIAFIQDNISDCQANIMQMEESKHEFEQEPNDLFNQCSSLEESKYLLEHFLTLVISKGLEAAQKETENKELTAKLHQENVNSTLQRDMLQFLIVNQSGIDIDESLVRDQAGDETDDDSDEEEDVPTNDPDSVDRLSEAMTPGSHGMQPSTLVAELQKLQDSSDPVRDSMKGQMKARRQKTTPEDLLYAGGSTDSSPLSPVGPHTVFPPTDAQTAMPPPPKGFTVSRARASRPPTAAEGTGVRPENAAVKPSPSPSPSLGGRRLLRITDPSSTTFSTRKSSSLLNSSQKSMLQSPTQPPSTGFQSATSVNSSNASINRHSSLSENVDCTPPGSPSMMRRGGKPGNVFSRLTRHGTHPSSPNPSSADDSVREDVPVPTTKTRDPHTTDINHNRTSAGPITPRAQRRSYTEQNTFTRKDTRNIENASKTPNTVTPTTPLMKRRNIVNTPDKRVSIAPKLESRQLSVTEKRNSTGAERKQPAAGTEKSPFSRTRSFRDSRTSPEKTNFIRTGSMRDRTRSGLSSGTTSASPASTANPASSVYKRVQSSPNPDRHSITASPANRANNIPPKSPAPARRIVNNRPTSAKTSNTSTSFMRSKSKEPAKSGYTPEPSVRSSKYDGVPIGTTPPSSPKSFKRSSGSMGSDHSGGTGSLHGSGEFYRRYTPITRGVINPASGRHLKTTPLIHAFTAAGHSKAVLHIHATDDLMFSASKDKTAKIWDLESGEEVLTLDGHPNNVNHVKFCEYTQTVITTCAYFMKIWDLREGNKCIRTITSAGQISDGSLSFDSISRQIACPPGEAYINDIAVNSTGSSLYSAAGNTVKIWDLRNFKAVGKLSGGHQAQIMVLAVDDTDTADGNICLVTGSKDHYIKIFDLMEDSVGVITPKFTLEPPHYDGIQSLCLMGDLLFSGSRDTCIKKWDLADQQLQHSINNAHKDWVKGLAFMPGGNCLVSGCRSGAVKLWHIDSCTLLGEMRAHNSQINHITTNNSLIFTASDERYIKVWYPCWDNLPSSVMDLDCLDLYI